MFKKPEAARDGTSLSGRESTRPERPSEESHSGSLQGNNKSTRQLTRSTPWIANITVMSIGTRTARERRRRRRRRGVREVWAVREGTDPTGAGDQVLLELRRYDRTQRKLLRRLRTATLSRLFLQTLETNIPFSSGPHEERPIARRAGESS